MPKTDVADQRRSFALPPTDEEQSAWDALSRDEQVKILREQFASKEANAISPRSVEEVLADARARVRSEG